MKIKAKQTHISYSKEEKYALFVEGKIKVPTITENKKRFNKVKERGKNKINNYQVRI